MVARTPSLSCSTTVAWCAPDILVGRLHELAACGMAEAFQVARGVFRGIAHVEAVQGTAFRFEPGQARLVESSSPSSLAAMLAAAACANLAASGPCGPKLWVSPRGHFQAGEVPARPIVPFLSAITLLGNPALISDCAPMIERVRPAQFTTTRVSGLV